MFDVEDGRPGELLDCEDAYASGDVLDVRRQRHEPTVVEPSPPPVNEALVVALLTPLLIALIGGLALRQRFRQPGRGTS